MVSLEGIVRVIIYLLVAAAVLGLLWWLIGFCQERIGGPPKVYDVIRVVFVILVILGLIGLLLSLVSGQPLFRL